MTKLIFGTGQYKYRVEDPFGILPAGMTWGNVSHVAVDSSDRVYAFQRKDPPIIVFDSDGKFLHSWGDGDLIDAHGIFITNDDELFVVDRDMYQVLKYTLNGELLLTIGVRGKSALQAPFNHPADVAVSPAGDIYVADGYGNSLIHKFSATGDHLLSWGTPGNEKGQLTTPHGIWVDSKSKIYVADRENNCIQVFTENGELITQWPNFYHPMDIWEDKHGVFYVTDQVPRFIILDSEGTILARGRAPEAGHGIYGDSQGNLYLSASLRGLVKLRRLTNKELE
ncbi:MAG: peptidylglycine monooxygenase [Chloroflexi bacterium]|jgi:peptidylglycine monooxygenase|nr:MAG: peptidylglycine monooxygenase [Chloroflexota bacterium]